MYNYFSLALEEALASNSIEEQRPKIIRTFSVFLDEIERLNGIISEYRALEDEWILEKNGPKVLE